MSRSSPPKMFFKKDVLQKCSKSTGDHPCKSAISIKFHSKNYPINLYFWECWLVWMVLTLFRMGGRGKKGSPTSFSPVASTNVGISPRLLPNSFKISSSYLVSVPNHGTCTKTTPQKKQFFWSNPYKLEVMITSLIQMLGGYQTLVKWPHLQYDLNHVIKFYWWHHWQKLWRHNLFFQNTFILRRLLTMFIKTIFKDLIKVKRIRNYVTKCSLYLHFLIQQNLLISGEKMLMSAELTGCVTWFIYFLDLL